MVVLRYLLTNGLAIALNGCLVITELELVITLILALFGFQRQCFVLHSRDSLRLNYYLKINAICALTKAFGGDSEHSRTF